ncbi:MAG: protein translocase subunit SecF [Alphaproteobacteria bacterium]|nr:protein translocase subunit SecF [Alphaproteobacteria bacterium]
MFRGIHFWPYGTKIDFVGKRNIALSLSVLAIIASLISVFTVGFNYGIDFAGGIMLEIKTKGVADLGHMRTALDGLGLGEVALQGIGSTGDEVVIRLRQQGGDEEGQTAALNKIKAALGANIEYRRVEVVGPKVGGELVRDGILALGLAILCIGAYLWFRFEWQYGLGGMFALVHDTTTTLGLFSIFHLEFDLTTVAALLTIAGYSINDSVVVYDRVRENLRKYRKVSLIDVLNLSTNETLSRTILTSSTAMLSVVAIYLLGGEVLHGFGLAMIWGIGVGTYSSIYIGMPVLIYFNLRREAIDGEGGEEAALPK